MLHLFPNGYSDQQAPWPLQKKTSVMHTKLPPKPPPAIISSPDVLHLSEFQLIHSGSFATPAIKHIARYIDKGLLSLFPELHCLYTNIDQQIPTTFTFIIAAPPSTAITGATLVGMCAALNSVSFDFRCSVHFIARLLCLVIKLPPNSYPPLLFLTPTHLWPKMNGTIISSCWTH
ncbi:hypothetical protein BT96DRAFT_1026947 [Gymnopus androsaceus JB14]|uniref:Uncharacterized protein n=1 Tax=Gymnopus androsaceus JB14 TaxID=1447944 RepID=A0A6A4GFF0_9AGAR|nr:hypothetical protein BT96DRAFT_1026947 [Gymnopus androsaceus JB14]